MRQEIKTGKLERLSRWLHEPRHAGRIWFNRWSVAVAWVSLLLAVLMPTNGLEVSLCWFESATGVPCPGCGMTRSLSCALRGMLLQSWQYHPMGLLVLALFFVTAIQSVCPAPRREKLMRFIEARALWFNSFYVVFVSTFVGFGVVRALFYIGAGWVR